MSVAYVPEGDEIRVAYAVSRRVGPAVVRNRVRRRLRAAVREIAAADGIAPGAYLVSPRAAAAERSYAELRADLGRSIAAAASDRRSDRSAGTVPR